MLLKAIRQLCKEPAALGPTLVGTASASGSDTVSLTGITDLQQGDLVIFWGTDDNNSGVRVINSSGWTVEIDGNNNSIQNIIAYKVMGSTVDTSIEVSDPADALTATAWRGVTWESRSGYTTASGNTINPVSSTVTTDNSVVIVLGAIDDDNSTIFSPPTGYTVAVQNGRNGGSNAQMYKTGVSAGTEDPSSYTWSSPDALLSRTVVLSPTSSGLAPCLSFGGGSSSQTSRGFYTPSIIFSNDGGSLSGWTVVNATINSTTGNPGSSIQATGAEYAYYDLGQSLLGKKITFDIYLLSGTNELANFYFGCNSSGQGNMLRVEGRTSQITGLTTTTSWTAWNAPTSGNTTPYSVGSWHAVEIQINSSSQVTWAINGTTQQSNVSVTLQGNYFAVHGDASVVAGALFDNITIETL